MYINYLFIYFSHGGRSNSSWPCNWSALLYSRCSGRSLMHANVHNACCLNTATFTLSTPSHDYVPTCQRGQLGEHAKQATPAKQQHDSVFFVFVTTTTYRATSCLHLQGGLAYQELEAKPTPDFRTRSHDLVAPSSCKTIDTILTTQGLSFHNQIAIEEAASPLEAQSPASAAPQPILRERMRPKSPSTGIGQFLWWHMPTQDPYRSMRSGLTRRTATPRLMAHLASSSALGPSPPDLDTHRGTDASEAPLRIRAAPPPS